MRSNFFKGMEKQISAIKGNMQTLFDQKGMALPVTSLLSKEVKFAEAFKEGEKIVVSGLSKGKGFAGAVKRHGFAGGPRTHGQSDRERAPGSIGSTTTPGRVRKGKRMAGRMGQEKVTVKNVLVAKIDPEKNILYLKGAVPGISKGTVFLKKAQNEK